MAERMNLLFHGPFGHIAGFPDSLLVLILLGISLGLMFAGRTLIKVLAFLVVGLVGATLGAALGTTYLGGIGWILGAVAGFFVGGIVGFLLLALGIGAALGYVSYVITLDIVKSSGAALVAGVVLFVVGVVLYGKILGLVSAVLGGLLFFDLALSAGLGHTISAVLAVVLAVAGLWVQSQTSAGARRGAPSGGTIPATSGQS